MDSSATTARDGDEGLHHQRDIGVPPVMCQQRLMSWSACWSLLLGLVFCLSACRDSSSPPSRSAPSPSPSAPASTATPAHTPPPVPDSPAVWNKFPAPPETRSRRFAPDAPAKISSSEFIAWAPDARDNFGSDGANGIAAGDFDGDGHRDILVGSHHGGGPTNDREWGGEATIIFGGPGLRGKALQVPGMAPPGSGVTRIFGARAGDFCGRSCTAADVDGDGIDDAVVTSRFSATPDGLRYHAGEVAVIFGRKTLHDTNLDLAQEQPEVLRILAERPEDQLGFTATHGDFDGDGTQDLVLGAFSSRGVDHQTTTTGEVVFVWGGKHLRDLKSLNLAAAHDAAPVTRVYGAEQFDGLGWFLGAGDLDGDGMDDAIMSYSGRCRGKEMYVGGCALLFGAKDLRGRVLEVGKEPSISHLLGIHHEDYFAYTIAMGDFDGDSRADFAMTTMKDDGPDGDRTDAGAVEVFFGGPEWRRRQVDLREGFPADLRRARVFGGPGGVAFGYTLASIRRDDPKRSQLVVGQLGGWPIEPGYRGQLVVFAAGAVLPGMEVDMAKVAPKLRILAKDPEDYFGYGLEDLGDIDGDGRPDLASSAWRGDRPGKGADDEAGYLAVLFALD